MKFALLTDLDDDKILVGFGLGGVVVANRPDTEETTLYSESGNVEMYVKETPEEIAKILAS